MNSSTQRLCVWSGPLLMVLFTGGFVIAGFLPPPAPSETAEQIRRLFIDDQTRIRVGLVFLLFGAALSFPWVGVLTIHVKRAEGRWAPLTLTQFAAGLILSLLFMFPTMVWGAAAYRPAERSAELTQGFSDLAWLPFIGIGTNSIVQCIAIALVVLRDKAERPVFPRWSAYFNIWVAALLAPGCLVIFFQTGPFAWNGLFAFWVPLTAFGSWFVVMAVLLFRAIAAQRDEEIAEPAQVL